MKTIAETKFNNIVKEGFHISLKPLGFRKKGNNFYLYKNGVGHIINIQKSSHYSKDHINFTINTAIFLPEFWTAYYNYSNKPVPSFPTESECVLRMRIGNLKNEKDTWYDVTSDTDEEQMIQEMKANLTEYILPHFGKVLSRDMLVDVIDSKRSVVAPLEKLIVFGELGEKVKAKTEYHRLVLEATRNPSFLDVVNQYGEKYGLI